MSYACVILRGPSFAFVASSLTSPEQLFRLQISPGQKQLPGPLKEEFAERSVSWRCRNTVNCVRISEDEALHYKTVRMQMINYECTTGMELSMGTGEITDAQRNIILQHHSSSIFQKSYASRYMPDTQAAMMRAASGMSRTIDLRRPRRLNLAQYAEIDRHPFQTGIILSPVRKVFSCMINIDKPIKFNAI